MKIISTFLISCFSFSMALSQGVALPYSTGFDSAAEKLGWMQYRTGFLSTYSWGYAGGAATAPTCVSHDYNVGGSSGDIVIDWFISPPINFTNTASMAIKVKTGGFSPPTPDNFEVLFGTNFQDPALGGFVVIANLSGMVPQYTWLDTTFSIPFVSDSGYIALKYKTVGAAWMTYAFDEITITADPASVPENGSGASPIRCFPNPFAAETVIRTDKMLENAVLNVYNSTGQLIRQTENITGQRIILQREDLAEGIYFIAVIENNSVIGRDKLIIGD